MAGPAATGNLACMRGVRHFLRDFTAAAVREHLRSQIEDTGGSPELTKNELALVRFVRQSMAEFDRVGR